MATPGELVKLVALLTGVDRASVAQHDRNLVIAGLRETRGRGRNAAKVTARSAAIVLTSVVAAYRAKDGVLAVEGYLNTQESHAHFHQHLPHLLERGKNPNVWEDFGVTELAKLDANHSFIDALEVLIDLSSRGVLLRELGNVYAWDNIRIIVEWPRTHARITIRRPLLDVGSTPSFKVDAVQADYSSNEPPPPWLVDNSIAIPRDPSVEITPKFDRWTEIDAVPIIYIGGLLSGKLQDLPRIAKTATRGWV